MVLKKLLNVNNVADVFHEIAVTLEPYKTEESYSIEFIVEGTIEEPIIGILYPGKKTRNRNPNKSTKIKYDWANLYDFRVIPYIDGKPDTKTSYTYEFILRDFEEHKKPSEEFWSKLEYLYHNNEVQIISEGLNGIEPTFSLFVIKWLWIQEDFNYKYSWDDEKVRSPIKYILETRTGSTTKKGAGRAKSFAVLELMKLGHRFDEVRKIIPLY